MVWATLHRLVVSLTLLAFIGAMTLQLIPPTLAVAAGTMPAAADCSQMAMPADNGGSDHKAPCNGMDPECIKQMGCAGTPSLPLRLGADFVPVAYSKVVYSTLTVFRDGRSIEPDLFPPIGL